MKTLTINPALKVLGTLVTSFRIPDKLKTIIKIKPEFIEPKYVRKEKYFNKWVDLADKQCEVIAIVKTITDLYLIYFICERKIYLLGLDVAPITDNQKLVLKSKQFEFFKDENCVSVRAKNENGEKTTQSSMKIWHIDDIRGQVGLYGYINL